jgi:biotin transporter BioY
VTFTLLCGYLLGWLITTIGLAVIVGKLNDPIRPQQYVLPLAVAAGAVWPLLILGAAQMAILALVMEATRRCTNRSRRCAGVHVDEVIDELLIA